MSEYALSRENYASSATAHRIGRQALWHTGVFNPELGVNDPLTHLEQYLEQGEAAIDSIDEDLITDIAERKLQPVFMNLVSFSRAGDDFISKENHFSMREMTSITEDKFAKDNTISLDLYKRAKIEAREVERLSSWFNTAPIGDVFIVESMPMAEERYTIVRIYQKNGPDELTEHILTLHNATVESFNNLHQELGVGGPESQTPLELLDNMYAYSPGADGFERTYVSIYDSLLNRGEPGAEYSFGLPSGERGGSHDDIQNVRRQTALRSVYLETLRNLRASQGYVTPEVIADSHKFGCGFNMFEGDKISFDIARELLDRSLQSVAATFNRASQKHLDALATSQDRSAAGEYASRYGGEARAEGIRYDGACPSASGAAAAEAAAMSQGYRISQDPSQCGTCPKCTKEYFVDEKVYKAKILECNNCHEAIRFGGGRVGKAELEALKGGEQLGFLDILLESLAEFNRQYRSEQAEKKAAQLADQQALAEKLAKAA